MTGERLDSMEQDLRRLTQGLDTLNGVVVGLEERLRTSLREDTNKVLLSLLPNTPRLPDSTVGFGVIPDGTPDGLEGASFNGFGDLAGRVTEVKDELRAKTHILEEIQVLVPFCMSKDDGNRSLQMVQVSVHLHPPLLSPHFLPFSPVSP